MPCKTEVARLVDRLSPAAELIGACNTVVVEEDGTMTGHITDGTGFIRNLKEHSVESKRSEDRGAWNWRSSDSDRSPGSVGRSS